MPVLTDIQDMVRNTGLIVIALFLCAVDTVGAQEKDTLKARQLSEVTVYGHAESNGVTSSAPLHLLGSTDFMRLGVTDIGDALLRLPGVTLRDYGGAGGMKTVSVRGFGARHTGVSYDGVMLSDIQSGEIDVSRYSLDNVQRVGLVVGDNNDIFITARQASAPAVLSIETLNGQPADRRPHLTAQMRLGSFGYANPFMRYVHRVGRRVTLAAMGEYTYADNDYPFKLRNGHVTTREHRSNSRMNSGHGELSACWAAGEHNRLWGKIYYYDNDRQLPGIVQHYSNVCGQQLHDRNLFVQARWMSQISSRLTFKSNAKFNWATTAYRDTLLPDRRDDATYRQREYYLSAAMRYALGGSMSVAYAADYFYNNLTSTLATDRRPWRHTLLQTAAWKYSAKRFTASARLLWTLCLNGAHAEPSQQDMRRWSPSLSLSYRLLPAEELYLRASLKNIFRVPTFNECYFHHYGSADVQPENTMQYNLGLAWGHRYGGAVILRLTVDGYFNKVTDKIVSVPYNMFIWRTINMGKVNACGLDVGTRLLWMVGQRHRIDFYGSYTYQRVANRTDASSANYGKQVPYQPLNAGSVSAGWENPWICVTLHGSGSGGRWATPNHYDGTRIGGYWDMGVMLWRRFKWHERNLELRADVENMLGKQYEIVGNYPMPRTQWKITVKWQM